MVRESELRSILAAWPTDCRPQSIDALGVADGFSGARLWRLDAPRGPLCFRRWPKEHPDRQRLEFIQAVLWHVGQEGFSLAPIPLETRTHAGFIRCEGHFWELAPWMPGQADYHRSPSIAKLTGALTALAQFHQAALSFPLPDGEPQHSPSLGQRLVQARSMMAGRLNDLALHVTESSWPELAFRAKQVLQLFPLAAGKVISLLEESAAIRVALQPCIRDVWHDHVLFEGQQVSGIVDFGAMRPECVAADIARLLGSLVGDEAAAWRSGLAAYAAVRPLSSDDRKLIIAFDQSGVLLSGLSWLEWIYLEQRQFENRSGVLSRLDEILIRLEHLAGRSFR